MGGEISRREVHCVDIHDALRAVLTIWEGGRHKGKCMFYFYTDGSRGGRMFFLLLLLLKCLRLEITLTSEWRWHQGWYILVFFGGLLEICMFAFPVYKDRKAFCVGVINKINKIPFLKIMPKTVVGGGENWQYVA